MSHKNKLVPFNDLIEKLEQEAKRPLPLNAAFKNKLRGKLLSQYEQPRFSFATVGGWVRTAIALTLLIFAVFNIRQMLSSGSSTTSPAAAPVSVTRPAPPIEGEVVYDRLLISWQTPNGMSDPITAESWQTVNGRQFRGQVTDGSGNLLHFVQNDGASLWRTYQAPSDPGWQPIDHIYQSSTANYQPPAGPTVPEWVAQPPFYSGLAWEGLVSTVLQPNWECTDYACVTTQLGTPILGIPANKAESRNYGFAGSLIDTQTGENGRSIATLKIVFSPNESGETISQYRQVKVDAETFTVLEITDFDGDRVLRHLERVERKTVSTNTLPHDFFSSVPDGLQVLPWQPQADAQDFAWLINTSPATETNLSGNPSGLIEMEIGYELVSAPEALLFVELLPEDWDLQTSGFPSNIGNSGIWIPISAENSSITVPVQLISNPDSTPASIVPNIKLILREPNTAYFFHEQTLTGSRWLLEEEVVGVETSPSPQAANDVWLLSATQQARASNDAPITLEITVGYQFDLDEEVTLKPLYAAPNWESQPPGRVPIDGLGNEIILGNREGTVSFTFSGNPDEMRQIVGTDQPVLVMQLGYFVEDENDRRELKILAMPTLTGFAIDLTNTEKVTYQIDLSNLETVPAAVISGTDGNGLTLRSTPAGQDIGILEEGSAVILNDEPRLESEGLLWQSVSTTIGKGWVVAEFLAYPEGYVFTEIMPMPPDDRIWIVKATQLSRSNRDDPITLEITVGFKLASADEAILRMAFIHPSRELTLFDIELDYNSLGNEHLIQTGTDTLTITATIDPEQITSAINSDSFVLMTEIGNWAADGRNGEQTFDLILFGVNKDMPFNVQSREEITYDTSDISQFPNCPLDLIRNQDATCTP